MNTCYIKCKRNVTLHEYDRCNIDSFTTMPRQAPYIALMVSFITYYVPGVCMCMVGNKFDDSPAVWHVFNDQVFIRSAVYCPYWSHNVMPLFS